MARRIPALAQASQSVSDWSAHYRADMAAWGLGRKLAKRPFHTAKADTIRGSARIGADRVDGKFERFGQQIDTQGSNLWNQALPSERFAEWLHGFEWLYDIHAVGSAESRNAARQYVDSWVEAYGDYHSFAWHPSVLSRRLLALGLCWSPTLNTDSLSDLALKRRECSLKQARYLKRTRKLIKPGYEQIEADIALSVMSVRDDAATIPDNIVARLDDSLSDQILPDGGHVSRSPEVGLKVFASLVALDTLLEARGLPAPPAVSRAIDRLGPTLAFFSHTDGGLATFHGSGEGDPRTRAAAMARSVSKPFAFAPHSGYQRLACGNTVVLMDVAAPAPFPMDSDAHVSPLAFEMSVAEGRLIVSCAFSPEQPLSWKQAVRRISAHSALDIVGASASQFAEPRRGFTDPVRHIRRDSSPITANRREAEPGVVVEGSHEGYTSSAGLIHRRRVFLAQSGADVRGEDDLVVTDEGRAQLSKDDDVAIRFHLHPDVKASLAPEGSHIRLDIGDARWVFLANAPGLRFCLEASAYLGAGSRPVPTQQIVLSGKVEESIGAPIRWALRKAPSSSSLKEQEDKRA